MEFALSSEMQDLLDRVRAFVDAHVIPLEVELERGFFAMEPALDAVRDRVREAGMWQPQMPRDHGGMGLSLLDHGLVSEQLGRSPLGHYVFGCHAPDAGNMELLLEKGTDEQRATFLAPLLAGTARSAFGMTEPEHAGSNPVWLSTRAVEDGDSWVIDGHKWFTTALDGAAFVIVMAVTDPNAASHERASMILVPTDTPGVEHVRNIPIMGDRGEGWMSHGELRLTGVRVPIGNLLGGRGRGFALAQARLGPGRIHHCMRWLGICDRSFDAMCRRAATRELSPGHVLAERQTIGDWIAESRAEIDAARLLVLRTAWEIDAHGAKAARDGISAIKFHTANVMLRVVDRALQVHGAAGMTDEVVLSHFYRHERAARIYDGPDEVHKVALARRILSGYGVKPS